MTESLSNRTGISDIEFSEAEKKHILDTPDKILRWIKFNFEEQELKGRDIEPKNRYIDLSDCIISTFSHDGNSSMTNLCDIIKVNNNDGLLDCFKYNGYNNDYYQEVLEKIVCRNSLIHAAFFHSTKFHKEVDFDDSEFKGHASFGQCYFGKTASFQNTVYTGSFGFENCIFNDRVWFNNAKFNIYEVHFEYSIFKSEFNANNIVFIDDIKRIPNFGPSITFYGAIFENKLSLSNIDFTRNCIFTGAKFGSSVEFINSNFRTIVIFENAQINGNILFAVNNAREEKAETTTKNIINKIWFNKSNISGRIDIERCEIDEFESSFMGIKSGAVFRVYESSIQSLNLTSIHNNGALILENNGANIQEMTLKSAINTGMIEVENTNIQIIKERKTARLLKDSALKCGNSIDALEFRKKEMELLKNETTGNKWGSRLLLWFNEISNKHNTDWIRGVKFTIVCWIGFYLLFLITSRPDQIYALFTGQPVTWTCSLDIANGINYLWSLNFLETLSMWVNINFNVVWWLFILKVIQLLIVASIYIIGKIAIGYGIYQTISAFRKYGK
jgi:hypothetical protein